MTWWIYALLSAVCWGLQYVLMEALFRRVDFAAAFCFLSLVNGLLVAGLMFILYPNQNWHQLWRSWPVAGLIVLYLLCGSGAYLFNAYAVNAKNATFASLLEISYPLFIILFTAIFFQKVHLNAFGFLGASLIFAGCLLVVLSRSR